MECVPSEQMENIPMVAILPSDSRQKPFAKKRKEINGMCYQRNVTSITISTGSKWKLQPIHVNKKVSLGQHFSGYHDSTHSTGGARSDGWGTAAR